MMKIKSTKVSFISIVCFIALSVGLYTGLGWSSDSFVASETYTLANNCFHDLEFTTAYGVTKEDIEALKGIEGIDEIQGIRTTYKMVADMDPQVTVVSELSENMDKLYDVEGKLPEKENEIALDKTWAEKNGFNVGDTINLYSENPDYLYYTETIRNMDTENLDVDKCLKELEKTSEATDLKSNIFTVTALVHSPNYTADSIAVYGTDRQDGIQVSCFMYVPGCAWEDYLDNVYTKVIIRSDELRGYGYLTEEYKKKASEIIERIEGDINKISDAAYDTINTNSAKILKETENKLEESKKKLEDAEKQLSDGKQQLADGQAQIEEKKKELADGQAALESAEAELAASLDQLNDGWAQLADAQRQVDEGEATLKAGEIEYNNNKVIFGQAEAFGTDCRNVYEMAERMAEQGSTQEEIVDAVINSGIVEKAESLEKNYGSALGQYFNADAWVEKLKNCTTSEEFEKVLEEIGAEADKGMTEGRSRLEDAQAQIFSAKAQLDAAKAQIQTTQQTLTDSQAQCDEARATLDSKWAELESGKSQLADGEAALSENSQKIQESEKEYEDGKKKYEDGLKQVDELREKITELQKYEVHLTSSNNNTSVFSINKLSKMFTKTNLALALFFVIIGMLVCYSTFSRLVNDQAKLIGTQKALGLLQKEITAGYITYSGVALVLGCILGILIGILINFIIIYKFKNTFLFEKLVFERSFLTGGLVCAVVVVLIIAITWISVLKILKKRAVILLNGEQKGNKQSRFYEKTKLWERLPLITKIVVNNCMNEKRRVVAIIIGIMGCTGLITTAFMLCFNLNGGYRIQSEEFWRYDTFVYFNTDNEAAKQKIKEVLDEHGAVSTLALRTQIYGKTPDGSYIAAYMLVPENVEEYKNMSTMTPWNPKDANPYEGAWLSCIYTEYYNVEPGYEYQILDNKGKEYSVTLDGFFECYDASLRLVLSPDRYEEIFGTQLKSNIFIVDTSNCDKDALLEDLLKIDGYKTSFDFYNFIKESSKMFDQFSYILVLVYVGLSIFMAVLVPLNLMQMFINEKKKELIILRINGYSVKATQKYIYLDNIFLSIIGIILGMIVGTLYGIVVISTFISETAYFILQISWPACLIGALGMAVMMTVMILISIKQVGKFKLSDINLL